MGVGAGARDESALSCWQAKMTTIISSWPIRANQFWTAGRKRSLLGYFSESNAILDCQLGLGAHVSDAFPDLDTSRLLCSREVVLSLLFPLPISASSRVAQAASRKVSLSLFGVPWCTLNHYGHLTPWKCSPDHSGKKLPPPRQEFVLTQPKSPKALGEEIAPRLSCIW